MLWPLVENDLLPSGWKHCACLAAITWVRLNAICDQTQCNIIDHILQCNIYALEWSHQYCPPSYWRPLLASWYEPAVLSYFESCRSKSASQRLICKLAIEQLSYHWFIPTNISTMFSEYISKGMFRENASTSLSCTFKSFVTEVLPVPALSHGASVFWREGFESPTWSKYEI